MPDAKTPARDTHGYTNTHQLHGVPLPTWPKATQRLHALAHLLHVAKNIVMMRPPLPTPCCPNKVPFPFAMHNMIKDVLL